MFFRRILVYFFFLKTVILFLCMCESKNGMFNAIFNCESFFNFILVFFFFLSNLVLCMEIQKGNNCDFLSEGGD